MAKEQDLGWALGLQERDEVPWSVGESSPNGPGNSHFFRQKLKVTLDVERRSPDVYSSTEALSPAQKSGQHLMPPDSWSADDLMRLVRHNDRVCPKGRAWDRLYMLLRIRTEVGRTLLPPEPVDRASAQLTTDVQRQSCLRRQLEWAESVGALEPIAEFIAALPEHDWRHLDTSNWPVLPSN